MHFLKVAIILYATLPAVALAAAYWWKTDIIVGNSSAFWNERFKLVHIAAALTLGAIWPIFAIRVAWSAYLRWQKGQEMMEEIVRLEVENTRLKLTIACFEAEKKKP